MVLRFAFVDLPCLCSLFMFVLWVGCGRWLCLNTWLVGGCVSCAVWFVCLNLGRGACLDLGRVAWW